MHASVRQSGTRSSLCDLTGVVGYLTMLRPVSARSPYIIMTVNCVWVAVAAFIALKAQFR